MLHHRRVKSATPRFGGEQEALLGFDADLNADPERDTQSDYGVYPDSEVAPEEENATSTDNGPQ